MMESRPARRGPSSPLFTAESACANSWIGMAITRARSSDAMMSGFCSIPIRWWFRADSLLLQEVFGVTQFGVAPTGRAIDLRVESPAERRSEVGAGFMSARLQILAGDLQFCISPTGDIPLHEDQAVLVLRQGGAEQHQRLVRERLQGRHDD